jgi:hypothetical protein
MKGHSNSFSASCVYKNSDLDEVAEVMFYTGVLPWNLIIWHLNVLKSDIGERGEAMFEGDERPCELFFFILWNRWS